MPEFILSLSIIPETGLSVGGSGNTGLRADKTIQRDIRNRPIIPASQLKGRLRHACETIVRAAGVPICRPPTPQTTCPHQADVPLVKQGDGQETRLCPICRIFGSPWENSPLYFRDLAADQALSTIRPGIGLNRRRKVVQENLLFFTETTAPAARPAFHNAEAVKGTLAEPGQALLLLAGLQIIRHWGGGKSRGQGWATLEITARFDGGPLSLDQDKDKEALAKWLQQQQNG